MKIRLCKYIAAFLVIIMSFGIMCSCSSEKDAGEEEILNLQKLKEATLTFYFVGGNADFPRKQRVVLDEVEKSMKDTVNAKLNFKWIEQYDKYREEIKSLLSSGDTFEAFYDFNLTAAEEMSDMLLDISSLFPEYAPNYFKRFTDEDRRDLSYEGELLAVPNGMPGSMRMCAVVREDFMRKYDIPEIANYDDYELYLKTVAEKEKGIDLPYISRSLGEIFAESYGYIYMEPGFVYKWDDPEINIIPWEQTDEFKLSVDTFRKWINNGYIDASAQLQGSKDSSKIHSYLSWCEQAIDTAANHRSDGIDFKVYPLYMDRYSQKVPITNNVILFNKNAKNPERALRFIEWTHLNQENYDLFMYGIQGQDYDISNDRVAFQMGQQAAYGIQWLWFGGESFKDMEYLRENNSDPQGYKEQLVKMATHNVKDQPLKGINVSEKDIDENVLKQLEEIMNKRFESYTLFENSMRVKDSTIDIDKFITEQKENGLDIILKEYKKLISGWLEKSKGN